MSASSTGSRMPDLLTAEALAAEVMLATAHQLVSWRLGRDENYNPAYPGMLVKAGDAAWCRCGCWHAGPFATVRATWRAFDEHIAEATRRDAAECFCGRLALHSPYAAPHNAWYHADRVTFHGHTEVILRRDLPGQLAS